MASNRAEFDYQYGGAIFHAKSQSRKVGKFARDREDDSMFW